MEPMIASGQVAEAVNVITAAARKGGEEAINQLAKTGALNASNFQRVLAQGDKVAAAVKAALLSTLAELAENIVGCLRLISGGQKIVLAVTSGKHTLTNASDVFDGYIDSDFKNWGLDVPEEATGEKEVAVYEMKDNGTYAEIFGGFGENLDRLCLTQDQIRVFCRDQRQWLHPQGYGTLFLFKVNGKFFVARVDVRGGRLEVYVYQFEYASVWRAEFRYRVVVPQL